MMFPLDGQLSPHFALAEMIHSTRGTAAGLDNTPSGPEIEALTALCVNVLEPARRQFGAIHIESGYRSAAVNKLVGGVPGSQHQAGQAADFWAIASATKYELARWIEAHVPFDQLILENVALDDEAAGWVHCSYVALGGNRRQTLTKIRNEPGYRAGLIPPIDAS